MQSCTCGSGCGPSMKNFKYEGENHEGSRFLRGLKFVAFVIVAVALFGFVTMHLWNWLTAGVVWLEADRLLASGGTGSLESNSVWRIPWTSGWRRTLAKSDGGSLGEDDARRAGKISRRYAGAMRPPRRTRGKNSRVIGLAEGLPQNHRARSYTKEISISVTFQVSCDLCSRWLFAPLARRFRLKA